MVRLGGATSPTYVSIFRGLQAHFLRHGIELDWVIYSNYDALVEAFVRREIDLAWNAPLAYVKTKRRLQGVCQVVAMRDVDVNFTTHFITQSKSAIATVQDLKGKRVALGSKGSMQAGLLPYYFLQQLGIDPARDLAVCSFYDERQGQAASDERDVVERVDRREYDAGAVSGRTIDGLQAEGVLTSAGFRIIWSSPGYRSLLLHRAQRPGSGAGREDHSGLCHHRCARSGGQGGPGGRGMQVVRSGDYHWLGDLGNGSGTSRDSLIE